MKYLCIGLGGATGAIFRVMLMAVFPSFFLSIPLKILCINVIGCFAMGSLVEVMALCWDPSLNMRHFLVQGVLSGFTTFSSFSLEFGMLYEKGHYISAASYLLATIALSISFFFLGIKFVRLFS